MAATSARVGFGATVSYNTTGTTYVALAEVYDLTPPAQSLSTTDATHHTSPDGYEEVIPSILRTGQASVTLVYDPDSTEYTDLVALMNAKTLKKWRIGVPNSTKVIEFSAYLVSVSPTTPREDKMTYTIELRPTGKPDVVTP
jgi:hypothetical protein